MCGQQPSCYPIGYQLNSRINCPRSSPCLPCRMKSIKENEGQYPFLRLLKNKGLKEESMTKVGLYAIGKSTTLESNKSLFGKAIRPACETAIALPLRQV